jgi:hypothetical protein
MPLIPEISMLGGNHRPGVPGVAMAGTPGKAAGAVAQGIASLGDTVLKIAGTVQATEDARTRSTVRTQWARGLSELELELANEADPQKHFDKLGKFMGKSRAAISEAAPSPRAREALELEFADFETDSRRRVGIAAARLSRERAGLALKNEMETATQTGDRAAYLKALDTAEEGGLVLPERREQLLREYDYHSEYRALQKEIAADPFDMERDLEGPDFLERYPNQNPESLESLRRLASAEANRARGEIWDNVLNASLDGKVLSKDELKQMAVDGIISPQQRASYADRWHQLAPPEFDPATYNQAFSAITSYDPDQDPTGATVAQLRQNLGTLPLPDESIRELKGRLEARLAPIKRPAHKLASEFEKQTAERFDSGDFGGGWWAWQPTVGSDGQPIPNRWRKEIISRERWAAAHSARQQFTAAWDGYLQNVGADLDPVQAQKTYDALFERMVLDREDAGPLIPSAPPAFDFGRDVDSLLGTPAPAAGKETSATPRTFGGQPIQPPGTFYKGARATVFGGKSDPIDNGLSAFGGTTGEGGKEGVAIPLDILKATFPGKDKAWFAANVRAVVKTKDGRQAVFPLADLGTAELVWQRDKRPVLDLTEGAVKQLGGRPIYKDGKLAGVSGLGDLSFALTTDNAGTAADLSAMSWEEASAAWFTDKKPTDPGQIASGLAALRSAWLAAQYPDEEAPPPAEAAEPWGDGSGGETIEPDSKGRYGKDGNSTLPAGRPGMAPDFLPEKP